ncbi:MAG: hypothetical protein K0R93_516 [Anaerosolibacter sp.]|jgi:REP element-mobilizing transposase RayT|uniref:transposase n=1 Tax=Anaerosolibacter sp. TaxID=1872527 RepID=UPI00262A6C87|nr:transposase [Anaerosolibacter sp.]MDF2545618.1 hypothetical protein [Anaerosolibacter sp.]
MEYPNRKLNRLSGYDYSQAGAYFITICTKSYKNQFGMIEDGEMHLNKLGIIARNHWLSIPEHFKDISIDEFVVMPNHIHGILVLTMGNGYIRSLQGQNLSRIIGPYKASVSREIRKMNGGMDFKWQKSYYDHIIRKDESLDNVREYIRNNPMQWHLDKFYSNFYHD